MTALIIIVANCSVYSSSFIYIYMHIFIYSGKRNWPMWLMCF